MKDENLIAARKQSGKTQTQAAADLCMGKQMYQKYEYGMSSNSIKTAIRITKMYNTTVEKLWGETPVWAL